MTLDLEDFEFAVAERFPWAFERGTSVTLATPRALIDHISARAPVSADTRSIEQHSFYRIRALLVRQLGCDPTLIRASTSLEHLMPDAARRRDEWAMLRAALGVREIPGLSRPEWLNWTITVMAGVSFLAAVSIAAHRLDVGWLVFLIGASVAGLVIRLALRVTEGRATYLPLRPATAGDLAIFATAYGSQVLDPALIPSTRSQLFEVVRELVRLEIGVPRMDQDLNWETLAKLAQ